MAQPCAIITMRRIGRIAAAVVMEEGDRKTGTAGAGTIGMVAGETTMARLEVVGTVVAVDAKTRTGGRKTTMGRRAVATVADMATLATRRTTGTTRHRTMGGGLHALGYRVAQGERRFICSLVGGLDSFCCWFVVRSLRSLLSSGLLDTLYYRYICIYIISVRFAFNLMHGERSEDSKFGLGPLSMDPRHRLSSFCARRRL